MPLFSIKSGPSTGTGAPNALVVASNWRRRTLLSPGVLCRYDSQMPLGPESSLVSSLLPSAPDNERIPVQLAGTPAVFAFSSAAVKLTVPLGSVNTRYCTLPNAPSFTA